MFKKKKKEKNPLPGNVDIDKKHYLHLINTRRIDFPDNEESYVVYIDNASGKVEFIPEEIKKMFT